MNTEYSVGNIRIRFESRTRRRWLVVLFYALLATLDLACVNNRIHPPPSYLAAWMVGGLAILVVALLLVVLWLGGPWRMHDDEREIHRREYAFARAYRALGVFIMAVFLAVVGLFPEPNPITPLLPPMVRTFLIQLPLFLLFAIIFLYVSLPPAILLWTEPSMDEPVKAN
jgi:UDP-N-acetylmuramyl pentapeptide phosphotransferase/UDP-N-acetylglucosamine-1-phosphate transferase